MGYRISRLGWLPDPPDFRDRRVCNRGIQARLKKIKAVTSTAVSVAGASTPVGDLRVDLRQWCSTIEDQGKIGSCTAQATVGALEYFERKTRGVHVDASRMFLYKVTRNYLGFSGDQGAFVRSAIKALRLFGAPPERYWPYVEEDFDAEPAAFHYAYAQNFKALEYFRLDEDVDILKACLDVGLPFIFGFTCFSSLFDPEVHETGVIPYPEEYENVEGGHAVLAVGYTDSHVIIRNSWGADWGEGGYGYLPWTYLEQYYGLARDCWVLINAEWVPDDEADEDLVIPEHVEPRMRVQPRPALLRSFGAASAALPVQPSVEARAAAEVGPPIIRSVRGTDPLRRQPMLTLAASTPAAVPVASSGGPVALYLKSMELRKSHDFELFWNAVNEIYFTAICWDLSGAKPVVYPPAAVQSADDAPPYHLMKKGDKITFVGDGAQLWWGNKPVVGGLYVRLIVMEGDSDIRKVGKILKEVGTAVNKSKLTASLVALATPGGVLSAAAITAISTGASLLTGIVANILAQNNDDMVDLFQGTYGADRMNSSRIDAYNQRGASIVLELSV